MTGRLPERVRGEGWEVWLERDGLLWTRDTKPMDGERAAVRVAAMERFLRRAPVHGVVVDDREPAGPDAPEAWEVYQRFVAQHPGLPIAVVTPEPRTIEATLDVRLAARSARLAVFASVEAAARWLREQQLAEDAPGAKG